MMGALIRALTNNAVENIEEALGMTDATSSAMKHAIAEWYAAWYGRVPTKTEDPCQRLPYAIVNKLCKATFGEYDSGLQHTDSAKGKYLDCVRSAFDACKTSFMTQAMIGGEAWAKPVPMPDGRLTWQIVGRDSIIILGRDASGIPSDVALCEKSVSADHHFYTLVERRTSFAGRLTIQYRLYCSDNKSTLGRRVPLASLPQYERLEDEYTFAVPIDGVGMVFLRMPITNCVDGSADGVSIYEPAMGLIHRINENELQFSREFELGRMRVVASADILRTHNGKKSLTDDVFVGLDGNEQSIGITPFVRGRAGAEPHRKRHPAHQAPDSGRRRNRKSRSAEASNQAAGRAGRVCEILQGRGSAHSQRTPAGGRVWPQPVQPGRVGLQKGCAGATSGHRNRRAQTVQRHG